LKIISKNLSLLFVLVALSLCAFAQSAPATPPTHQESSAAPATPATSTENAAQPSHAENEAAAEGHEAHSAGSPEGEKAGGEKEAEKDEEAKFKESGSVKWLAKTLGLPIEKAYWVSIILNFLIVAVLIVLFLKSNLPKMFRERTAAIQKGMEEARRASEESRARLSEIESRLAKLDNDIVEMRAKAEQDAKAEDDRIRAATEEEKRKIIQSAQQEIGAASNAARRDLKQYTAELAVSLAEKKISVSDATDKVLVGDFASHLADGHSSSKGGR
jgi:F-type H+-transporting ATPase subunit b